jgi:ubiquitin thioesterase OTU1
VTRRIIDSDNSCLFNAVGYNTEGSLSEARKLRQVVKCTVASDPVTFNDGFLGKENEAYQAWIADSSHWGGAIELYILSRHYECEIAAFDIQTKRCDIYGQEQGFSQRCMVVYDGLHYDALAVAAFENAPEELDGRMFEVTSPDLPQVRASQLMRYSS